MKLQHVPLLQLQRDLYDLPRDASRFDAYLHILSGENQVSCRQSNHNNRNDIQYPPLMYLNPMGRTHVADRLDQLIQLRAEDIATEALLEAQERLSALFPSLQAHETYQHGLTILDDTGGGWTDRYATDFTQRFRIESPLKRFWLTTCWLTSDTNISETTIQQEVWSTAYRGRYILHHGVPTTLEDHMKCHGHADVFAGRDTTTAYHGLGDNHDEMVYTQAVLAPLRHTISDHEIMVALYGDPAADALGHARMGLSCRAGLALALTVALRETASIGSSC